MKVFFNKKYFKATLHSTKPAFNKVPLISATMKMGWRFQVSLIGF